MHHSWIVRLVSWSGAAAFALSLAYAARAYVVAFADVAPAATPWVVPALVNVLLFSAFALHHSVLARTGAKDAIVRLAGPEFERPLYVWMSSLLFLACCHWWQPLPGTVYAAPARWEPLFISVQLVGALVTIIAARRIDVRSLAGVRPPRTNALLQPLETSGLYGLVRHPIYFGWILMVLGAPVMTVTRASFALSSIVYLVVAVPFEERGLLAAHGETYRAYQRRVRARLVPGVY